VGGGTRVKRGVRKTWRVQKKKIDEKRTSKTTAKKKRGRPDLNQKQKNAHREGTQIRGGGGTIKLKQKVTDWYTVGGPHCGEIRKENDSAEKSS